MEASGAESANGDGVNPRVTGNAYGAALRDLSAARGRAGPATATASALDSLLNLDGTGAGRGGAQGGQPGGTGRRADAAASPTKPPNCAGNAPGVNELEVHARTPQPGPAPSPPGSEGKLSRLPVSLAHLRERAANFPGLPSIFRYGLTDNGRHVM